MTRLGRLAAATAVALAVTGCATMNVGSQVRRGVDFAGYRTYDWGPADALPTSDAPLDRNSLFNDRVQGAVEKQLAARGYERATSGTPNLLIHYHANVSQRIDVDRTGPEYSYCHDDDCNVRVVGYEAGTLVLDIVDARTKKLVWRGWAQSSVGDLLQASKIDEAVTRMLAKLPVLL